MWTGRHDEADCRFSQFCKHPQHNTAGEVHGTDDWDRNCDQGVRWIEMAKKAVRFGTVWYEYLCLKKMRISLCNGWLLTSGTAAYSYITQLGSLHSIVQSPQLRFEPSSKPCLVFLGASSLDYKGRRHLSLWVLNHHDVKKHGGVECMAPCILLLGTRWTWVVRFTPLSPYHLRHPRKLGQGCTNFPLKIPRKLGQGCTNFRLRILGARRVTWSNFHPEEPQILGAVVQSVVIMATRRPGFARTRIEMFVGPHSWSGCHGDKKSFWALPPFLERCVLCFVLGAPGNRRA
jgi:hypothetical protein